ncbi:MAG: HlyD family secretion protein [Prevotella sp.]|nr:HlyD family secretion protein [Prevotella sp.]
MPKEIRNSIVRSEEVQDILSAPPHILLSVGSSVIGGILLLLLIGCFIFRYPDTIVCTVTITNSEPPVWVIAKSTGRMQELYVNDQQSVCAGTIIAVIENPADTHDVLTLDSILAGYDFDSEKNISLSTTDLHLGNIQNSYSALSKAVTDYNNFINNNLYDQRIAAEEAQLEPYKGYVASIEKQVKYSQRINTLSSTNYRREKTLHDKGLTSVSDLESIEQMLLSSKMSAEQMYSSLANAKIQVAQIKNTIAELRLQREQEKKLLTTSLQSAWETVMTVIQEWKQTYLLQSPISGIVSYNNLWKVNQNINTGDRAFSVVSNTKQKVIGKAKIPVAGSGKVKTGQHINIQLDGYPYLEYGFLTGKVQSVSAMSDEDAYSATFELSEDVFTSYGKRIGIVGDLTGTGEVITNNLSVAERLISPLRYLFHRSTVDYK